MSVSGSLSEGESEPPGAHQVIVAGSGSSVYAVLHGDMHIRNGYPVYQVMPFPLADRPVASDRARQQPSRLLAADSGVVAFSGRASELSELAAWRDDPQAGVSVMLIHAYGGQGKTRLAGRFAADSAADGWTAWAARHLSDPTAEHVVAPGDPGRALLLVVDYADRWPVDDLQLLLGNPLLRRPERSRVLLLARPAGTWWSSLRHRLDKAGIAIGSTLALPPLADTVSERREAFVTACDAFAGLLGASSAAVGVPQTLDDDIFQLVLTIHMAALVAVDAHQRGTRAPADPAGLSGYLLDRENDFWSSLHDHQQISTTPELMGRTVYTATLTHSLRRGHAAAVLERAGIAKAASAPGVLNDHARCYPLVVPNADNALEALYPDRLGEDFLALTTPGHTHADYIADPWAQHATTQLLTPGSDAPDAAPVYVRSALTVLIETARRWPHIAHQQLYPLLQAHPQLALSAGGTALAALVERPDISLGLLEAIESRLPRHRQADLDIGIAALVQRLTDHRLSITPDPAARARLYIVLGWRLANAGQIRQAQRTFEDAIQLYRPLAAANLAEFGPDLALALNSLGSQLAGLGHREEALNAAEESLRIRRRLADPAAFEHQFPESVYVQHRLAESLTSVGNRLSAMGRHEQAVLAAAEGVQIRRRLAAAEPAAFEPNLAIELSNFGNQLAGLGRRQEALSAAEEAVQIRRRLAAANPAAFEDGLAGELNNLGLRLSDMGRRQEALSVAQEAVQVFRRLVDANTASFEPGLARSVDNLGQRFSDVGRREEALAAAEEAIQIRQRLAAANPASFEPGLAVSLDSLSQRLSEMGHRDQALKAAEESVQAFRRLAQANPAASEPDLAATLNNLSLRLSAVGRREDALSVAEEAVQIFRRSAKGNPEAVEPNLGRALNDLGNRLAILGRRQQALAVAEESAEIFRRLAAANPAAFELYLASALTNLSNWLSEMGRREAALASTEEALQIWRRLAAASPAAFERSLTSTVYNLALRLSDMGRRAEALTAIEEAVGLYRGLAKANAAVSEPGLARALHGLGIRLADLRRHEDALIAAEEATQIWQRLVAANPAAYESDFAASLDNLGLRLSDVGRREEALTAAQTAVEIDRRLAKANPAAAEPNLAGALNNLGLRLSDVGRREEALTAAQTAVEIGRRLAKGNPAAFEPGLASGLHNVGLRLSDIGRLKQAVAATQEAVQIRRRLAAANPAGFEAVLGDSLINLGAQLTKIGKRGQAQVATGQAVQIYRRLAGANQAVYEPRLALALRNANASRR